MESSGLENAGQVKWDTNPLEYAVVISRVNTAHEFTTCLNLKRACFDGDGLATVSIPRISSRHSVQLVLPERKQITSYIFLTLLQILDLPLVEFVYFGLSSLTVSVLLLLFCFVIFEEMTVQTKPLLIQCPLKSLHTSTVINAQIKET